MKSKEEVRKRKHSQARKQFILFYFIFLSPDYNNLTFPTILKIAKIWRGKADRDLPRGFSQDHLVLLQ